MQTVTKWWELKKLRNFKKQVNVLNCNKICFSNWIMQIIVLSNG